MARAQTFFYIVTCVRNLKIMSNSPDIPFAFETPEDASVDRLEAQISGMPWDCQKVHQLLFDTPMAFSNKQAWTLAGVMVRVFFFTRKNKHVANRRLAFAMGTNPHLGENSLVCELHPDILRLILNCE
jgi:hypothetical protein